MLLAAEGAASGKYATPQGQLVIGTAIVFGRTHVPPKVTESLRAQAVRPHRRSAVGHGFCKAAIRPATFERNLNPDPGRPVRVLQASTREPTGTIPLVDCGLSLAHRAIRCEPLHL